MVTVDVFRGIVEESHKGIIINIYVKPWSQKEELRLESGDLVFYTSEPAEKGRANAALIRFLARRLGIPASRIEIVRGQRDRMKKILVMDASLEEIVEKLAEATGIRKEEES